MRAVVQYRYGPPEVLRVAEVERRLRSRLEQIAAERYPDGFWIDDERRRIPDHWNAHARPSGGFFDSASELSERFG